jgi:hypothetical protein
MEDGSCIIIVVQVVHVYLATSALERLSPESILRSGPGPIAANVAGLLVSSLSAQVLRNLPIVETVKKGLAGLHKEVQRDIAGPRAESGGPSDQHGEFFPFRLQRVDHPWWQPCGGHRNDWKPFAYQLFNEIGYPLR